MKEKFQNSHKILVKYLNNFTKKVTKTKLSLNKQIVNCKTWYRRKLKELLQANKNYNLYYVQIFKCYSIKFPLKLVSICQTKAFPISNFVLKILSFKHRFEALINWFNPFLYGGGDDVHSTPPMVFLPFTRRTYSYTATPNYCRCVV